MRYFPLLVGDNSVPNPPNRQPYRLMWNFSEIFKDLPSYIIDPVPPSYVHGVKVWDVLTDHEPLDFSPTLEVPNLEPVGKDPLLNIRLMLTMLPEWKPVVLKRVSEFANAAVTEEDEFKIFHFRYGSDYPNGTFELFRYNFDGTGTKFVTLDAVYVATTPQTPFMRLRACLDGVNTISTDFQSALNIMSDEINVDSNDIRVVFTPDSVRVYYDQPGTLFLNLALPAPIVVKSNAEVRFFTPYVPTDHVFDEPYVTQPPNYFSMGWLAIYDGTF